MRIAITICFLGLSILLRGQTFTNFEYYFNNDPGVGLGNQIVGFPSAGNVQFNTNIQVPLSLPNGINFLNIRGQQSSSSNPVFTDRWSNVYKIPLIIYSNSVNTSDLDGINKISIQFRKQGFTSNEAFYDVILNANNQYIATFNVPNVVEFGIYDLIIRSRTKRGQWSVSEIIPFFIHPITPNTSNGNSIDRIEYFFNNDPGIGNGTSITFIGGNNNTVMVPLSIPLNLSQGINMMYFRIRNSNGHWSPNYFKPIIVYGTSINKSNSTIVKLEYFIDSDPGYDNATNVLFSPNPSAEINNYSTLDLSGLLTGEHTINYRCKNSMGNWSETKTSKINISCDNGAILFSKQNGEWDSPLTWECGRVPSITDPVFIKSGHRINVNSGVRANAESITIDRGSVFDTQSGAILDFRF
jgi:hypothetical protein